MEIEIDLTLKQLIVQILDNKKTIDEVSITTGYHKQTLREKMRIVVMEDESLRSNYEEYKRAYAIDYSKIDFRALYANMVMENMVQSQIAEEYEIPIKMVINQLKELGKSKDKDDLRLFEITKKYISEYMKKNKEFKDSKEKIKMDKYLSTKYGDLKIYDENKKSKEEIEYEELKKFDETLNKLRRLDSKEKVTLKEISEEIGVSTSGIRRKRVRLEELKNKFESKDIVDKER